MRVQSCDKIFDALLRENRDQNQKVGKMRSISCQISDGRERNSINLFRYGQRLKKEEHEMRRNSMKGEREA